MDNEKNNIEIYFAVEYVFSLLSKILNKNGFKVSLSNEVNKIENNESSFIDIIFKLSKNLAKEKISEKDFILSVQKQMGASEEKAKNVLRDIKEKILPFAEKVKIGENLGEKNNDFTEIKPPIGIPKIGETMPSARVNPTASKKSTEDFSIKRQEKTKKPIEDIIKKEKIINPEKLKTPPKKQDTYREPIE